MGAYFFNKCEIGTLSCREDLEVLKHTTTSANEVSFSLSQSDPQKISYAKEFFRYLYQKSPFTLKISKIKFNVNFNINNNEEITNLLLNIEKNLNKYIITKKFNIQKTYKTFAEEEDDDDDFDGQYLEVESKSSSSFSKESNSNSLTSNKVNSVTCDTITKIKFLDLIYVLKKITIKEDYSHSQIMNHFGLMFFTKNYTHDFFQQFFFNANSFEYDHLLPINIMSCNENVFIKRVERYIKKYSLTNMKFPPFVIKDGFLNKAPEKEENFDFLKIDNMKERKRKIMIKDNSKLLDKLVLLIRNSTLTFFDLSIVIFVQDSKDLFLKVKSFLNKFYKIKENFDFIYHIYIFSGRYNLIRNMKTLEKEFKRAVSCVQPKKNSYIVLHIFKQDIIKCFSSQVNPYQKDSLLNEVREKTINQYESQKKTEKWRFRNQEHLINDNRENQPELIKFSPLIMSKEMYKIYTNTRHEIFSLIYTTYSTHSVMKKLKKKTIMNTILQFLSIKLYKEEVKPNRNDIILKEVYDIQKENLIPMVKFPRKDNELHSDLIHCHYDHVYNLLQ